MNPVPPPMTTAPQNPPPVPPQWGVVPPPAPAPQYPAPMWNQQPSQIPPPVPVPVPPQPQPSMYQPAATDEIRTLWIGDLQYWMDESYLHGCFASAAEVISVKVIRNKLTGQSEGYGFVEFTSRAIADSILQAFNGQMMPNIEQKFRLNWATLGAGERRDDSADHTIFVGDLAADVTDYVLQETFRAHYTSVKGAKVVTDRTTGRSKGYGFVRFGDATEQTRAMTEMNGVLCSTRPMRIGPATTKKSLGMDQQNAAKASFQSPQATLSETDPNNTTVFVGALDATVTEDHLRQVFGQYGELVHVKIPAGKRCGFVQFAKRACAEEAILMLNGAQLGGQHIRLSWGRSPSSKQDASAGWTQPQQDPNQYGSYYGYGQGYESYGYAQQPQDPNMYAYGAYSAYGNYPQQQ